MRAGILIAGILLGFLGLFFSMSLVGLIIGIPMLLFGFLLFIYGLVAKEPGQTVIVQPMQAQQLAQQQSIRQSVQYCINCGTSLPVGSKFCSNCGSAQSSL